MAGGMRGRGRRPAPTPLERMARFLNDMRKESETLSKHMLLNNVCNFADAQALKALLSLEGDSALAQWLEDSYQQTQTRNFDTVQHEFAQSSMSFKNNNTGCEFVILGLELYRLAILYCLTDMCVIQKNHCSYCKASVCCSDDFRCRMMWKSLGIHLSDRSSCG